MTDYNFNDDTVEIEVREQQADVFLIDIVEELKSRVEQLEEILHRHGWL